MENDSDSQRIKLQWLLCLIGLLPLKPVGPQIPEWITQ